MPKHMDETISTSSGSTAQEPIADPLDVDRPSSIPLRVWRMAINAVMAPVADDAGNSLRYFAAPYEAKAVRVVALAIMAETEYCAQVADKFQYHSVSRKIRARAKADE